MSHGLAHFVIHSFTLLREGVGIWIGCDLDHRSRRWYRVSGSRRRCCFWRRRARNASHSIVLRLPLLTLFLASYDATLRIILFDCLFDLLEIHRHRHLGTHLALARNGFQDLNDLVRKLGL